MIADCGSLPAARAQRPKRRRAQLMTRGIRDTDNVITHEEVLAAANEAEPKMTALFKELVRVIS